MAEEQAIVDLFIRRNFAEASARCLTAIYDASCCSTSVLRDEFSSAALPILQLKNGPSISFTEEHREIDRIAAILLQCTYEMKRATYTSSLDSETVSEHRSSAPCLSLQAKYVEAFRNYMSRFPPIPLPMFLLWLKFCLEEGDEEYVATMANYIAVRLQDSSKSLRGSNICSVVGGEEKDLEPAAQVESGKLSNLPGRNKFLRQVAYLRDKVSRKKELREEKSQNKCRRRRQQQQQQEEAAIVSVDCSSRAIGQSRDARSELAFSKLSSLESRSPPSSISLGNSESAGRQTVDQISLPVTTDEVVHGHNPRSNISLLYHFFCRHLGHPLYPWFLQKKVVGSEQSDGSGSGRWHGWLWVLLAAGTTSVSVSSFVARILLRRRLFLDFWIKQGPLQRRRAVTTAIAAITASLWSVVLFYTWRRALWEANSDDDGNGAPNVTSAATNTTSPEYIGSTQAANAQVGRRRRKQRTGKR